MSSSTFWLPHIHSGAMTQTLAGLHTEGKALPVVKVLDRGPVRDVIEASPSTKVLYRRGEVFQREGDYWNLPLPAQQFAKGRQFVAEAGDLPRGIYFEIFNEQMPGGNEPELARRLNTATMGAIAECRARGYFPVTGNWSTGTPDVRVMAHFVDMVQATVDAGGRIGYHPYGARDPFDPGQRDDLVLRWSKQLLPALWAAGLAHTTRPIAWATEGGLDLIQQLPDSSGAWKVCVERGWYTIAGPNSVYGVFTRLGDLLRREGFEYGFAYDYFAPKGAEVGSDDEAYDFARGRWKDESLVFWNHHWLYHQAAPLQLPEPGGTPEPPPAPTFPRTVYALGVGTPPYVNLRAAPSAGSGDIADVPRGTPLEVTEERAGFYKVVAWVSKAVVSAQRPTSSDEAAPE